MCPNKDWAKHWFREPKKPVLLWDGSWQTGRNQSSHCFALFSLGGCQLQFSLGKHCKSLEQSLLFSYNYMGCPLGGKKKSAKANVWWTSLWIGTARGGLDHQSVPVCPCLCDCSVSLLSVHLPSCPGTLWDDCVWRVVPASQVAQEATWGGCLLHRLDFLPSSHPTNILLMEESGIWC